MGGNNSQANRFPLPSNWTVSEFICMVVPVPNDVEYIAMMRGLLDTLTWSRSFRLHRTEQAARMVADTWAAAFASEEITFQECGMPFLLRQNPANSCQLQQSSDGGTTWTLAFDYGLCATAITQPAPFPGSTTGDVDAAANVVKNIQQKLIEIADANCAGSRDTAVQEMLTWLRMYEAGYSGTGNLGAIYDAYCALSPEEQATYAEDASYCDQFTALTACSNVEGLFDALDCLNELLVTWLDETNTDLMDLLNKAAGFLGANGVQSAAGYGGSGGGAGFTASCAVEYCWFFEGSDPAYTMILGSVGAGGNPDNCGIGVSVLSTTWKRQVTVQVDPVSVGVLLSANLDDYYSDIFASGQSHSCALTHYNSGGGVLNQALINPTSSGVWTTRTFDALNWTLASGDYLQFTVFKDWGSGDPAYQENADGTTVRIDNMCLQFEG